MFFCKKNSNGLQIYKLRQNVLISWENKSFLFNPHPPKVPGVLMNWGKRDSCRCQFYLLPERIRPLRAKWRPAILTVWKTRKEVIIIIIIIIVPIVIGTFGTVTKVLLKGLEDLKVGGQVDTTKNTALLRTTRIPRTVLETWGDLLSLKLQWKTISEHWGKKTPMSQ